MLTTKGPEVPAHSSSRVRRRRAAQRESGFTLIELMLAATLGALLVVGVATMSGLFAEQVKSVKAESDDALERTVSEVGEATQHAWIVSQAASDELETQDAYGNSTRYFLQDGALKVLRPNGESGSLLTGVSAASFELETMRRLREALPITSVESPFDASEPDGTLTTIAVTGGTQLALGFSVPGAAPASMQSVSGVSEKLLSSTLDKLSLYANATNGSQGKISPVLECVYDNGGGLYIAYFGYSNPNPWVVTIPIGAENRFTPNPQDRGQPTVFLTGRHTFVFEVPFIGASGNQVWTLNGKTSTANSGSKKCSAPGQY